MELNEYQHKTLNDLTLYLNELKRHNGNMVAAFKSYWKNFNVEGVSYNNHIKGCAHVCLKVPTAGGKTYIGINAIEPIFSFINSYQIDKTQLVIWLVPSLSILEQTLKAFRNPEHDYNMYLRSQFNGRVNVFDRNEAMNGIGFTRESLKGHLNILVMSFDALKAKKKDNRKAYAENGNLISFVEFDHSPETDLEDSDSTSLVNVIRRFRPVVIVDESHNADTDLSTDMLNTLNPCMVLDLTATPKSNSNVISYVNAAALVKHNMVKLPVIVYSKKDQHSVFVEAHLLRNRLEERAKIQYENGGDYVRPIVLFQAESNRGDDSLDFYKVKENLIKDLGIPPEQIKIKTANVDELKGVNLLSKECEVRYIITVNALKEGWDCSFAYILATFANKSSETDVTQILGRILRKPNARKQKELPLNCSYVITASSVFQQTLKSLESSLKIIGFGEKDYRVVADVEVEAEESTQEEFVLSPEHELTKGVDCAVGSDVITPQTSHSYTTPAASDAHGNWGNVSQKTVSQSSYMNTVESAVTEYEAEVVAEAESLDSNVIGIVSNHKEGVKVDISKMNASFEPIVEKIQLPKFYVEVENNGLFGDEENHFELLGKEFLLKDFSLSKQDSSIDFSRMEGNIFQVVVRETDDKSDTTIDVVKLKDKTIDSLIQTVSKMSDLGQINQITNSIFSTYSRRAFYPIEDSDLKGYISKIITDLTMEQRIHCIQNLVDYAAKIKLKIESLANDHARKKFFEVLETQRIHAMPDFKFPKQIVVTEASVGYANRLYEREASLNGLEEKFITGLIDLENIVFWHRNLERFKGFFINGFIKNHYPDFIVLTKKNNLILIETKGGDRDNSDSVYKLELGKTWENISNQMPNCDFKFKYLMVFDSINKIDGAFDLTSALSIISKL